jgi:glycogen debranching enzyme
MIEFGRDICGDLDNAMRREWLVTNGTGSYACGAISGANTRCYHGALIAALDAPVARTLLVAKIEATAHLRGTAYHLDTHEWADGSIEPRGYELIESFQLDGRIPTWTFALAEAQVAKRVWMIHEHDTTLITFTHARGADLITLDLKALCTYRDHHDETQGDWTPTVTATLNGLRVEAFEGATPYFIKITRSAYTPIDRWRRGFKHRVETERGLPDIEDYFETGTFRVTLQPGETIALAATTEEDTAPSTAALDWQAALDAERQRERALIERSGLEDQPPWIQQLVLAADQFVVNRSFEGQSSLRGALSAAKQSHVPEEEIASRRSTPLRSAQGALAMTPTVGQTVIAGYHWFSDWGRDTMIALPGLCLTTRRYDVAKTILKTFSAFVDKGMLPNRFPDQGEQPEYNTVDATLWYIHAINAVAEATNDWSLVRDLYPVLKDILAWHMKGTRYQIHVEVDGLIYAGEPGVQLTWMDAKVDDWVVTPRIGKPVEINALWIHALRLMAKFAQQAGHTEDASVYQQQADRATHSFRQRYWYAAGGYLYDVIDGPGGDDASLRPNQLFALSLEPDLLTPTAAKSVIDVCSQQLLTSYGLRSLAPTHEDYQGIFTGDHYARDGAYHQGTVWGWLIGPFVEAHYNVYHDRATALSYLRPFEQHLRDLCVGSISEVFYGDAPHLPRGCAAQAWSVAEVLRMWVKLTSAA